MLRVDVEQQGRNRILETKLVKLMTRKSESALQKDQGNHKQLEKKTFNLGFKAYSELRKGFYWIGTDRD